MKKDTDKKEKKEKQSENPKKFFQKVGMELKKKWLINGTKTIILVVIIVAIYIGINILLGNVVLPEIDCTQNKIYSLSQETNFGFSDCFSFFSFLSVSFFTLFISLLNHFSSLHNHNS